MAEVNGVLDDVWRILDALVPGPTSVLSSLAVTATWLVAYALAPRLARRAVAAMGYARRFRLRPTRLSVVQGLVADAIRGLLLFVGLLMLLTATGLLARDDLIWIFGLLSAGFGLAARPLISDVLHGVAFIFGDALAVGEKVHLPGVPGEVEGTIEHVGLRAVHIRAQTGELYLVPNGEVRVVRNFGRGSYSVGTVQLRVPSEDLDRAVAVLNAVKDEALARLPEILEPWRVISPDGTIAAETQLMVVFKTGFGQAAELRPRLQGFLQRRLDEAGVRVVG